jgi:hypothetical protein
MLGRNPLAPRKDLRLLGDTTWRMRLRPPSPCSATGRGDSRDRGGAPHLHRAQRTGWSRSAKWTACSGSMTSKADQRGVDRERPSPRSIVHLSCSWRAPQGRALHPADPAPHRAGVALWSRSRGAGRWWSRTSMGSVKAGGGRIIRRKCSKRRRSLAEARRRGAAVTRHAPATTCSTTTKERGAAFRAWVARRKGVAA